MNLKNKSVLIYDFGLFLPIAMRLSRSFGKVYYYCPWQTGYPSSDNARIGAGIPNLMRVDDFWEYTDKVDMIAFLDVGTGHLQKFLREKGYRVFGAGVGERLEQDRIYFREVLAKNELPVPKYEVIKGLDNLKKHLKDKKDKWVKISTYRGVTETFKFKNWLHSKPLLELGGKLGEYQKEIEFIVEDDIPGVEFASDWIVCDGIHLPSGIWGFEQKDCGYCGKAEEFDNLPEGLQRVDEALEKEMPDVRGFVAIELREGKDKKPYAIDPCMRPGSPPSELLSEMYDNLPEIMWAVSGGEFIEPEVTKKYGAEILLKSDFAKTSWCAVDFPKDSDMFKFRNLTRVDGQYYYIPKDGGYIVGAVIGMGNTLEEAQAEAMENAEQVEAEGLYYDEDVFDKIDEQLEEARGIVGRF